jgi:5-methylcytosine-specific restriction endonuclease McrA
MACKDTERERARHRAYYAAHRDRLLAQKKEYRIARRAIYQAYFKSYHLAHGERRRAAARAWGAAHREEKREKMRAYAAERREDIRTKNRAYRAANHDEIEARRRARHASDPDKRHSENARRRALRRGAVTERFRKAEIYERDRWICQLCHTKITKRSGPDGPSIDHVIPLSKGGAHTRQNVVTAHLHCNTSKNNRPNVQQQRLFG